MASALKKSRTVKINIEAGGVVQAVECLPSKCKALRLHLNTTKKKKKKKTNIEFTSVAQVCNPSYLGGRIQGQPRQKLCKTPYQPMARRSGAHLSQKGHCLSSPSHEVRPPSRK
jgi:hypothetical protein